MFYHVTDVQIDLLLGAVHAVISAARLQFTLRPQALTRNLYCVFGSSSLHNASVLLSVNTIGVAPFGAFVATTL